MLKNNKQLKYKCGLKGPCKKCGNCCRFRPIKIEFDEEKVKREFYYATGFLYLFSFTRMTITLLPWEVKILKNEAKKRGISIKILPKKFVLKNNEAVPIDYFLDHDVCPFLSKNLCTIYEKRPLICRCFPDFELFEKLTKKYYEQFKRKPKISYEEAKRILNQQVKTKIF